MTSGYTGRCERDAYECEATATSLASVTRERDDLQTEVDRLAPLAAQADALREEIENHLWEHVTAPVQTKHGQGARGGRRCRKCRQWAMGDGPGQSADEVCPKARRRFVTEWAALAPTEADRSKG